MKNLQIYTVIHSQINIYLMYIIIKKIVSTIWGGITYDIDKAFNRGTLVSSKVWTIGKTRDDARAELECQ